MPYKMIFVFLEGSDDDRFFGWVVKPILDKTYDHVRPVQYSGMKPEKVRDYLKSVNAMGVDYFFLCDINSSPCVTTKKQDSIVKYGQELNPSRNIVVIKEIESWYLAGLDDKSSQELGVKLLRHTDDRTKEHFNRLIPKKFDSRIDFMIEILNRYCIETAKEKNKSFGYFMSKVQGLS